MVVPAFDEAARIGPALASIGAYLDRQPWTGEIIVVLDGCRDATSDVVRRVAAARHDLRVLDNDVNRGKGYSVRRGMLEGRGARLLFTDADLSTPIAETDRLLARLEAGFDVAIGSRALRDSVIRVRQPWWREGMGRLFNVAVRAARLADIRDTQCGFKAFTREAGRRIFERQQLDRFAFDVEILWIARRLGCRVAEVPVAWENDRQSRVHPVRDSARMLRDLARIRLNAWRGRYDR